MITIPQIELSPGFRISRLINGLWQVADMERGGKTLDQDAVLSDMEKYVLAGLTTFDMADHYGSAEILAGRLKQQFNTSNKSVQLLTKWVPDLSDRTRLAAEQAVQRAHDRMSAEQIDLLQYHAWNYTDPIWWDHLFWLQELQLEGKIKLLGLTNFDQVHLKMVVDSGIEISSNQVSFSVLDQRAKKRLCGYCADRGIHILAFGVLAGGFLSDKWLNRSEPTSAELSTWSRMKYKRYIDLSGGWQRFQTLLKMLRNIADSHQVTIAQVAARYILQQPGVGAVIVGARLGEGEHIDENSGIFSFELSSGDLERLDDWYQHSIPGDTGDEYRRPPYLTAKGDLSDHLGSSMNPDQIATRNELSRPYFDSGTSWESMAGYSRAIRCGNRILVSGTTATHKERVIGGSDPSSQTHFIIDKIAGSLRLMGASLEHVVRTRIYLKQLNQWEPVALAHGERFAHIRPANTMIQANIIGHEYLVEIEAEAELPT